MAVEIGQEGDFCAQVHAWRYSVLFHICTFDVEVFDGRACLQKFDNAKHTINFSSGHTKVFQLRKTTLEMINNNLAEQTCNRGESSQNGSMEVF